LTRWADFVTAEFVNATRQLLVIADDIGIGPATTAGILRLAAQGIVTGSVLLVNSPHADDAVRQWRQLGTTLQIGWHPNLTLDAPLSPPAQVASLIRPDGTFWPLGDFLQRWLLGLLDAREIERELRRQLQRFTELIGQPPLLVNCHQHVGLFAPIGEILYRILSELSIKPYVRRIQEPWSVLRDLPGARVKRALLGWLGRRSSRMQASLGFPGNDWLAGITKPNCVLEPEFFVRWLRAMPGQVVELMCHPGEFDRTLVGRDCTEGDGLLQQRVNELRWLGDPSFVDAVKDAGFRLVTPTAFLEEAGRFAQCA
jgi:chitin disaccharide deacetylase